MDATTILAILELAAKYGIPAIKSAIEDLDKDNVSVEDIDALESLVKPPESYFKGNSGPNTEG